MVLRNKSNYTHTNVGAKVHAHQPSLLMVSLTRSTAKVLSICLGLWCLWQQQGEHHLTAQVGYFDGQNLAKRPLVHISADICTLFFYACGDYLRC